MDRQRAVRPLLTVAERHPTQRSTRDVTMNHDLFKSVIWLLQKVVIDTSPDHRQELLPQVAQARLLGCCLQMPVPHANVRIMVWFAVEKVGLWWWDAAVDCRHGPHHHTLALQLVYVEHPSMGVHWCSNPAAACAVGMHAQ